MTKNETVSDSKAAVSLCVTFSTGVEDLAGGAGLGVAEGVLGGHTDLVVHERQQVAHDDAGRLPAHQQASTTLPVRLLQPGIQTNTSKCQRRPGIINKCWSTPVNAREGLGLSINAGQHQ